MKYVAYGSASEMLFAMIFSQFFVRRLVKSSIFFADRQIVLLLLCKAVTLLRCREEKAKPLWEEAPFITSSVLDVVLREKSLHETFVHK